jgi:outer membrane receptor protein involved in Fe transport
MGARSAEAQTVTLPPEVVTAARAPQPAEQVAVSVRTFDADTLRATPAATLDGALRAVPGFSLFRRSDSFSANPTAQGVSLRGLGPSGASRSLVLLDGVPLNDPFGGWVAWSKVPREGLARVEIVPGGGATAWGNAALGGVVQLLTQQPSARTTAANATFGDFGTRSAEVAHTQPGALGAFDLGAQVFATEGFALVAPERRGPIDVAAWSRHTRLNLRWRQSLGDKLSGSAAVRSYEEQRGNGTPYQRNGSREKFVSLNLVGTPADQFTWTAVAYAQDQSFASTFSAVNSTRTAETPASDQFAVPATTLGAAWTGLWQHANDARTSFGTDTRYGHGETREHFTFTAGNFTRLRVAGGAQGGSGLFALHERALSAALRGTVGARFDRWSESNGHRRESDRATGVTSRNELYADTDGTAFSPSVGLVWKPAQRWRVRSHAQQAFRRPTLNELYRPFRQGANVTEANPALRTESVTAAEVGVEWRPFGNGTPPSLGARPKPAPLALAATAFWNDLHDAVGNVTIARGPGTFPVVGPLAAGGLGRQRLNLDRTRTQGLELSATWNASAAFSLNAAALFNDATVRRATVAPALVGKQVAQVPRRSAAFGATWRAPGQLTFTPRVRWIGRQFEDDENALVLGEAVVADLGVTRPLTKRLTLFLTLENLTDARVETGRSADGVVNVGTPRLLLGGVRGSW